MTARAPWFMGLLGASLLCPSASAQERRFVWQGLPPHVTAGVERRDRFFAERLPRRAEDGNEFVFERDKTWGPGATVTVAFNGGTPALHEKIATMAQTWAKHAKVNLEFKSGGAFRKWSPQDQTYAAQVRIGFAEPGYWSAVGTDASDPLVMRANEASMNFEGFTGTLPDDWSATVLHEFGHALGFHHEHQNPSGGCQDQFRWKDDAGYVPTRDSLGQFVNDRQGRRPGLYTLLGGPPNNWTKRMVDDNLAKLPNEEAYTTSIFDPTSIMKYFFEADMFVSGEGSRCYSKSNVTLSDLDKKGARAAYPADEAQVAAIARIRAAALDALLRVADLSPEQKQYYQALRANFAVPKP